MQTVMMLLTAVVQAGPTWTVGGPDLSATFALADGHLRLTGLTGRDGLNLDWDDRQLFTIRLSDGSAVTSAALTLDDLPEPRTWPGDPRAARLAARLPSQGLRATFSDPARGLQVVWTASHSDGARYLRQELQLRATRGPLALDRVETARVTLPAATADATYDGLPVVTDRLFVGVEHPMSRNTRRRGLGWSPAEMAARGFTLPVAELADELTVRFDYQRGHHRIDVAAVELRDAAGALVSSDTHPGYSGDLVSRNVYRLRTEGRTEGALHVKLGGVPTETDSWGTVTLTGARAAGAEQVTCELPRRCELRPGEVWRVSTVIGAYTTGQLRRDFGEYLERERAHPYRQYWHYNSWYDLNIGRNDHPDPLRRMTEAQCLAVIDAFGRELHARRGVGLDGFVWDDGWDDWNTLWQFHAGFPRGFAVLKAAADQQGAGQGAWLSPWGGYGGSHDKRVAFGRAQGYETNASGFSLGGPRYYAAFRDTCLKMIRDYHQTYFKFDGIGGGTWATGAPVSIAPDLDALVRLLGELRAANPDVFINCTVGTWPSPWWTFFADSIWRGGEDFSRTGPGNPREQWITYRDSVIHERFVSKSPLYPLNSLMYHGLLVAPHAGPASMPTPAADLDAFRHELLMSVGCGSGLGELYVTPGLLTLPAWDALAEALRWSRSHAAILRDTHWVGGSPRSAVYGYAAWHPTHGGTLVLRNPTPQAQTFRLEPVRLFELPPGAPRQWQFRPALGTRAVTGETVELAPFEVLLLDAQAGGAG